MPLSRVITHLSFFLHVLLCWNKVMVITLMHIFVINPLFKTVFFSLYHYGKYKANSSAPLPSQVNERIGGHCLIYRNIMPI